MKIRVDNIRLPLEKDNKENLLREGTSRTGISPASVLSWEILHRSLDARRKKQFFFQYSLAIEIPDNTPLSGKYSLITEKASSAPALVDLATRPLIVGSGPAGLFAALTFLKHGVTPVLLERGLPIEERDLKIKAFFSGGQLDPDSNIQFGEGGAGAYSDGKLTSRSKDKRHMNEVYDTFIRFGAPSEIKYLAKPHIGTDSLLRITAAIRDHLLKNGADIKYSSKVTGLCIKGASVAGIIANNNGTINSRCVLLAAGHSARDLYETLNQEGVELSQKAFATGTRMEHPAELINMMQYGKKYSGHPGLGAAEYFFTFKDEDTGRGAYTFCMCPGGEVLNASSSYGLMACNGMSLSTRAGRFSNAAVVVPVRPEDLNSKDPLAGIEFQKNIEKETFIAGGSNWQAPSQRLVDFLKEKETVTLPENSYRMGTTPAGIDSFLPSFITGSLRKALRSWSERFPILLSDEAVLIGSETRTSSPVRIMRQRTGCSTNIKGLFPCGEMSGYSGGIVSSAIDGIKTAEKAMGIFI
jgi:hypothetical protein